MHKKIEGVKITGFSVTAAAAGEKVKVRVKDWAISDSPLFYVYAEQIANIIFPKLGILNFRDQVNRYLVLIHPDNTANIYQKFRVLGTFKVKRSFQVGEPVYAKDIEDVAEVRFPDISINSDDRVIFLERSGWRFGIFYDFTKKINADTLAADIAELHKNLVLEDVLQKTLAEIQSEKTLAATQSKEEPKKINEAFVITEGKTDWKHLEKAFEKIGYDRNLEYSKPTSDLGDMGLLKLCRDAIHQPLQNVPVICVFDRDNPQIIKELIAQSGVEETEYQSWGNNYFSMMLPKPKDRERYENISIEMYYSDETIKSITKDGKRLFFSNELKLEILPGNIKKLIQIPAVSEQEFNKKIFSTDVDCIEDLSGHKIGISKTVFAEHIHAEKYPFKEVDFKNFRYISCVIEKIITTCAPT